MNTLASRKPRRSLFPLPLPSVSRRAQVANLRELFIPTCAVGGSIGRCIHVMEHASLRSNDLPRCPPPATSGYHRRNQLRSSRAHGEQFTESRVRLRDRREAQDLMAAVTFIWAHAHRYHVDFNRPEIWGSSAEANLALEGEHTHQSAEVQAVVSRSGPYDFVGGLGDEGSVVPGQVADAEKYIGCSDPSEPTCLQTVESASPTSWVTAGIRPRSWPPPPISAPGAKSSIRPRLRNWPVISPRRGTRCTSISMPRASMFSPTPTPNHRILGPSSKPISSCLRCLVRCAENVPGWDPDHIHSQVKGRSHGADCRVRSYPGESHSGLEQRERHAQQHSPDQHRGVVPDRHDGTEPGIPNGAQSLVLTASAPRRSIGQPTPSCRSGGCRPHANSSTLGVPSL